MIKIKHLDKRAVTQITKKCLEYWSDSIESVYDEFEELYEITIADSAPLFIKYWSGVNDNSIYLHIGSKILAIQGEVLIC